MYYSKRQIDSCSPKLQLLLWQHDRIYRADRCSEALEVVLAKIIRRAREEKQGFVYIKALFDMLFFQKENHEPRKGIPYAELFLREGRKLFEETYPTDYAPHAFRYNYIYCFEQIGEIYMGFHQISTKKMEQFFNLYYDNAHTYGGEFSFYECKLKWELICRNTEEAKKSSRYLETHPMDDRCYVCANQPVNQTRIMSGELDAALAHSAYVISGNIPSEVMEGYETCNCATAYYQYTDMVETCLSSGRIEFLDRVLPLAYKEILADEENESLGNVDALIYGLYRNFERYEDRVREAGEELGEQRLRFTPYEYLYACLIWMTYFKLLHRSGNEQIFFPTDQPIPLEADSTGRYRVSDIAAYFEQIADGIGVQFEKSREKFAYAKRKECFEVLLDMRF